MTAVLTLEIDLVQDFDTRFLACQLTAIYNEYLAGNKTAFITR